MVVVKLVENRLIAHINMPTNAHSIAMAAIKDEVISGGENTMMLRISTDSPTKAKLSINAEISRSDDQINQNPKTNTSNIFYSLM